MPYWPPCFGRTDVVLTDTRTTGDARRSMSTADGLRTMNGTDDFRVYLNACAHSAWPGFRGKGKWKQKQWTEPSNTKANKKNRSRTTKVSSEITKMKRKTHEKKI